MGITVRTLAPLSADLKRTKGRQEVLTPGALLYVPIPSPTLR
jgi:hypothetical protein